MLGCNETLLGSKGTKLGCNEALHGSKVAMLRCNETLLGSKAAMLGCKGTLPGSNAAMLRCNGTLLGSKAAMLGCNGTLLGSKAAMLGCNETLHGSKAAMLGCNETLHGSKVAMHRYAAAATADKAGKDEYRCAQRILLSQEKQSFHALRARVTFLSGKVTKTICAGHSPPSAVPCAPQQERAGPNSHIHVLRHTGLAPALASGARLALRRERQNTTSPEANNGHRYAQPILRICRRLLNRGGTPICSS